MEHVVPVRNEDPLIKNEPDPIPDPCMCSPLQGIGLLEIEIAYQKVRVTVKGTDGTGYERKIVPFRDHLLVTSKCIISNQVHVVYTEHLHTQNNLPYYQMLRSLVESLPNIIRVDQLNFYANWRQCRADAAYLANFEFFKKKCITAMRDTFENRMDDENNRPVDVGKLFIEYDGSRRSRHEVQVFLDNIDMVGPREIEIRSPRDLSNQSELHLDHKVTQSAGWNAARKMTIGNGFWMELKPEEWRNLREFSVTIPQITAANLESILRNLLTSITFVSCTINLMRPVRWAWRSVLPAGVVEIPEYEFEYEGALRGRFGDGQNKISIRRVNID